MSFGGVAGASWLRHRFETLGRAPDRDSLGLTVGALIGASVELTHGFDVFAVTVGQVIFIEQRRADGSDAAAAQPALRLTLGAGKNF